METNEELESLVQLVLSASVDNIRVARRIAFASENEALKDYIRAWESLLKQEGKDYKNPIALATYIKEVKEMGFNCSELKIEDKHLEVLAPIVKKVFVFMEEDALITKLLNKFVHLEQLNIYTPKESLANLYFEPTTHLKELFIHSETAIHLPKSIAHCKELEQLNIYCSNTVQLPDEIGQLRTLKQLNYVQGQDLPKERPHQLVYNSAILQLHQLESLSINAEAFEHQANYFNHFPNLVYLKIVKLYPATRIDISFLVQLKQLTTLVLEGIDIEKEHNVILGKLANLDSLSIHNCTISELNLYNLRILPLNYIYMEYCRHHKLSGDQLYNILKVYFPMAYLKLYAILDKNNMEVIY